ncbi:unnamed protein product, partial [Effrenium voratum]
CSAWEVPMSMPSCTPRSPSPPLDAPEALCRLDECPSLMLFKDRRPRTVACKDLQKVVGPWLHCLYQDVDTPLGILFSVDPGAFCDCIDDGPGLFGLLRG